MNVYQEMVEEFHAGTNSTIGTYPEIRDRELRAKLIMEEAVETVAALGFIAYGHIDFRRPLTADPMSRFANFRKQHDEPDFPAFIDGMCDLLYVTLGSAVAAGIDLDPFFAEVHRANMQKLEGPKREDGKQLKPEGWRPPDIEGLLAAQRAYAEAWRAIAADGVAEAEA